MDTTMTATIKGTDWKGEPFTDNLEFRLIPPDEDKNYYGTGYYMRVKLPETFQIVDVRYTGTTDIEILADHFIKRWYGTNAEEIIKQFPPRKSETI